METFAPKTDAFLDLQVQLPENSQCCLYVHNDLLVLHSNVNIFHFTAKQGGQLLKEFQSPRPKPFAMGSNTLPVVDSAKGLFFIFQQTVCACFTMETSELVQSFT